MEKMNIKKLQSLISQTRKELRANDKKETVIGLGNGLLLKVRESTAKYYAKLQNSKKVIGDYEELTLSDAYAKVIELRKQEKAADREKQKAPLFKDFWQNWRKVYDEKVSKDRILNVNAFYNQQLYKLDNYRIDEITPALLLELIEPLQTTQNNKHNALTALKLCFDYGVNLGALEFNKVISALKLPQFKFNRNDVKGYKGGDISLNDLRTVMFEPLKEHPLTLKYFLLLITMTSARNSEIRNLKWDKVHFDAEENCPNGYILIPNSDTKTRRDNKHADYLIPFTNELRTLLLNLKAYNQSIGFESAYLFPRTNDITKPLPLNSRLATMPQNISNKINIHGIRKVVSTFLNENRHKHRHSEEEIEHILNHKTRSQLSRTYNKYNDTKEKLELYTFLHHYLKENVLTDDFLKLIEE